MTKKKKLVLGFLAGLFILLFFVPVQRFVSSTVVPVVGDAMGWRSLMMAGRKAVNCGEVRVAGDPKAATDCALKAQSDRRAFRVRYDIMGYDSAVAGGLVRTVDGRLYALSFDGDPSGGGGVSLFGQRVTVTACPQPFRLYVNPKGRLNCFQQQLSPPADLMSPNLEPY